VARTPQPIGGFPEWLPAVRREELRWLDAIRAAFERYGYASIETPAVEELDTLLAKGETDKEIYAVSRLHGDDDSGARLGLHYDLTVPFARYVAQHYNELEFPFKRHQVQKAWRGERPQEGRFREFLQCDIDVIDRDELPLDYDVEMPVVLHEVLTELGVPPFRVRLSNRKLLLGFLQGLVRVNPVVVARVMDKIDKVGPDGVRQMLLQEGMSEADANRCLKFASIRSPDEGFADAVRALDVTSPLLEEGIEELRFVLTGLNDARPNSGFADLSIARGFDYYTGAVYEMRLDDFPELGSICSGGRYDDLAGSFINRRLPGTGISLGLTRLFAKLVAEGLVETGASSPAQVLVVLPSEERRAGALAAAAALRERGLAVDSYLKPAKLGKQLQYASRLGIPHVWFPPFEDGGPHEVKDMASGDPAEADPATWLPAPPAPGGAAGGGASPDA
jgi:histidyl-tRNA synthetase